MQTLLTDSSYRTRASKNQAELAMHNALAERMLLEQLARSDAAVL
jgi:hypothetical protein